MPSNDQHPTPWRKHTSTVNPPLFMIEDSTGYRVALVTDESTADRIIEAVNEHDKHAAGPWQKMDRAPKYGENVLLRPAMGAPFTGYWASYMNDWRGTHGQWINSAIAITAWAPINEVEK